MAEFKRLIVSGSPAHLNSLSVGTYNSDASNNQISSSGNFLECPQPLPLQWANLYSAWNLAFVSHFPDFVF